MSDGSVNDLVVRAHHAAVCVQDFESARDFYVRVLGFEVEGEMDRRGEAALGEVVGLPGAVVRWGMLVRDGFRLELFKYYTPEGRTQCNRQCDAGYTHLAFEVSDVDEAYRRVIAAGHRTTAPPKVLRGGRTKVIYLLAPEGSVVELIEFPQRAPSAPST
ncbi:MAG TPA: VOC family protein [Casimicrobiaceae bacterium]|nr:VOC family protein [Casimicrobiaceae bacterium]